MRKAKWFLTLNESRQYISVSLVLTSYCVCSIALVRKKNYRHRLKGLDLPLPLYTETVLSQE